MHQPEEIRVFPGKKLLSGLILIAGLWACGDEDVAEPVAQSVLPAPAANLSSCHEGARFALGLTGRIDGSFEWRDGEFQCESMRRPDDAGARLRFVGNVDDASLALIIAIPELKRGATGSELASNLTLHIEDTPLFFGTQGMESCWADISSQDLIESSRYNIAGEVYCIDPLSEINGDSSITIVELAFSTRVDWDLT